MQIRKNTKAFKTIISILEACKDRPDRDQLVRLFITKAGQTIHDRIYIEGIQSNANIFYEMNYQAVWTNLQSPGYQLYASDELPGIYFLRGSNKSWDETPFEFAEIISKKFAGLPELPVTRKKETPQKYTLPVAKEKSDPPTTGKTKQPAKAKDKPVISIAPKQPNFHLRHAIEFTNLERFIYSQAKMSKRDVLTYYDKIADYLLPWLKDKSLSVREQSDTPTEFIELNTDALSDHSSAIPDWIQKQVISNEKQVLLCNDKNHLLFYVEHGYLEFSSALSRLKLRITPEYIALTIDSSDLTKTIDATLATDEVLKGLHLPSFIKTDGLAGFHIYIPLDAKSDFKKSNMAAEYICKLIRLKIPDLVTLGATDELTYGKVSLNYNVNGDDKSIIAPYSLVQGSLPSVATPLQWDEVQHGLQIDSFTSDTILKRLAKQGDPFETFFKKKVNADDLLDRLKANYSFLL